ncbi:DHH family phosphoesterase [Carboxylicivirga sp. N1Y90]|uniref:DHH family phosphoesterase n=1 Tax=Carboxylicivirga fragile TaxID=3417571 RepID=UPI003D3356D1|nr:bifunctional oligoribonuclease/PAP phosphatase NrnA [Marinilabiliaceae bacterium N1Y90]
MMDIKHQSQIDFFKSYVNNTQKLVIVPHNNPDGDALGSSLGLCNTLKNMGKEAVVISPNEFPDFLNWMHGVNDVLIYDKNVKKAQQLISEAGLVIFLDFNALSRIKCMEAFFKEDTTPRIMIDHHPYPENETAAVQISVPEASSTCELLFQVLIESGFETSITKEAAECIYAGIMTDTGSLNYNSSRPDTYLIVAKLLGMGIDKEHIHHMIFHNNSFDRMRLLGYALGTKMERLPKQKAAFIALGQDELKRFNFKPGDTEGFVNQALWIEGVQVSAMFTEKNNLVKASFRSRNGFPANRFSETYFNGGGHFNAAGGESKLSLSDTIERFKTTLKEFCDEHGF